MSTKPSTAPIWQWSACDLAGAIRDREVTSVAAVTSVVERVRAENPRLNAIVDDLTEQALEQAASHDRTLEQAASHDRTLETDGPIGPLHGVPVSVKINVDTEGRANSNGVTAFKDMIAPHDSPVVSNLRKAGAILIGRTNTPEFSFRATTVNALHGRTLNPWDDDRSPGGSSGGASAAVAAGFGPLSHGNDIGGSLRFPAMQCAAVTIRPTLGRVPAFNPSGKAERSLLAQLMSVQGVIGREVRDVRLGTKVLSALDARDPLQVPVPFEGPALDPPLRVAVCTATNGYAIAPGITAAVHRAADALDRAGYRVEEATPPLFEEAAADALPALYGDCEIFMGQAIKEHGSDVIQQIFADYFAIYPPFDAEGLLHAMSRRTRYARAWSEFSERYPLILTPFMMRKGFTWNEDAEGRAHLKDIFDASVYSWLINYLGLPAAIAPAGSDSAFDNGFPISVQIVARRYREDLALDAAEVLERENGIAIHRLWRRSGAV
jgi:amidase